MISHNESYLTWMSMPQIKESRQTQTYLNNWVCWAATALTPTPAPPPLAQPLIFGVKRSADAAGGEKFAKISSCYIRMSHVTREWECFTCRCSSRQSRQRLRYTTRKGLLFQIFYLSAHLLLIWLTYHLPTLHNTHTHTHTQINAHTHE